MKKALDVQKGACENVRMFEGLTFPNARPAPAGAQSEAKSRLARETMSSFQTNSDFRVSSGAEERLIQATRAYNLIPSAADRALFDRMGVLAETYDPIIRSRVNNIVALLTRVFVNQDKTYSCEATPVPQVPESVTAAVYAQIFQEFAEAAQARQAAAGPDAPQDLGIDPAAATEYAFRRAGDVFSAQKAWAAQRAERMDRLVDDIFAEGEFGEVQREAIFNMAKTGTGVVIGPCEHVEEGLRQTTGDAIGVVKFEQKLVRKMKYFSPDTLDCFPSPGAKRDTEGDLCVRVRYSLPDLSLFAKRSLPSGFKRGERLPDGWDPAAVGRLLYRYRTGTPLPSIPLPIDALIEESSTDSGSYGRKLCAEGIRRFASLSGETLSESGVKTDFNGKKLERDSWYESDVIVIDNEVVCARVCDPVVGRPVMKMVCYADPSSWFGGSFAFMLRNVQALMNVVMASLKKQMQMAAGPMFVWNDFDNIVGKENPETFKWAPYKNMFRAASQYAQAANSRPVDMIEFATRLPEMLKVIEAVNVMADELLGFPRQMFGTGSSSGAIRTARGMAMMQEAANINASWVIGNIDSQFVRRAVKKLVAWINVRHPDPSVKGDVSVVAHGALGQVLETAKRDEAQNMYSLVSRDQYLQQTLGRGNILKIFRNMLEKMGYPDPDSIVPSAERIEEQEMIDRVGQMQAAMPPPQKGGPQGGSGGSGDGAMDFQTQGGSQGGATPTGLPEMSGTSVATAEPAAPTDTSDVARRRGAA